jgi:hypothetical protein
MGPAKSGVVIMFSGHRRNIARRHRRFLMCTQNRNSNPTMTKVRSRRYLSDCRTVEPHRSSRSKLEGEAKSVKGFEELEWEAE